MSTVKGSPMLEEVADELVAIAQRARQLAVDGHVVALHGLLEDVRRRADSAQGAELLLLEVGEAFLRALARSDLGRSELALRRFVVEHPEASEKFLAALLVERRFQKQDLDRLESAVKAAVLELVEVGVLRELDGGAAIDLRPSVRGLVRDLISPPAFRLWHRVQQIRTRLVREGVQGDAAAQLLASELGVTVPEARQHLSGAPVATRVPRRQHRITASRESQEPPALTGGRPTKVPHAASLSTLETASAAQSKEPKAAGTFSARQPLYSSTPLLSTFSGAR